MMNLFKRQLRTGHVWMLLVLLVNSACQPTQVTSISTQASPAKIPIIEPTSTRKANQAILLPDFIESYSITIVDNWSGYLSVAPVNSLYTLKSSDNHYEGNVLFSVGGYFVPVQKKTAHVSVPEDVVQAFFQKLSQADLENGKYEPVIEHTDDYPEIIIRLTYGKEEVAETIEFYTSSQGEGHVPWKVTYNNKSYIINSDIPMQALEIVKPYLAQDVLENLIKQVE